MRNPGIPTSSFQFINTDEIEEVPRSDELTPVARNIHWQGQGYPETWSCAWAPDCSYFAWSCGNRIVYLVPWDRIKGRIVRSAEHNHSHHSSVADNTQNNNSQQHVDKASRIDRCNCPDSSSTTPDRPWHRIDCGGYVCSVAFGSGTSGQDILSMWKRFKFDKSLVLVTGLMKGNIKVWDCNTGNLLMELLDHKKMVTGLSFAYDGSLLFASCSLDGTLKLWDLNDDGNMYKTLRGKSQFLLSCKWCPTNSRIAAVGSQGYLTLWNLSFDKTLCLKGHHNDIKSCDFSPDGALLATSSSDTRIVIWDTENGDVLLELGHLFPPPRPIFAGGANDHYVRCVSFSRDGMHLSSVCDDGFVRFWNLSDATDPAAIATHANPLCCTVCPNSCVTAVGDRTGKVCLYEGPKDIPSLEHMCRMSIRQKLPSSKIDFLHLPLRIKEFLKYHQF